MEIKKANRKSTNVILSITGPSGSGKTKSGLEIGKELKGPLGFIDTERGRSGIYADEYDFDVIELVPPYSPDRYIEALRKFEDAGYGTVIIDSASHEWEQILEMADAQRNQSGKPLQGLLKWKAPKAEHKKFVNELLRTKMNIIVCLRAKAEYEQRKGSNGRDEIVRVGWKEIAESSFIYEMTVSVMLSNEEGHQGFPTLTKCPSSLKGAFPVNKQVNSDSGRFIAEWIGDVDRNPEVEKLIREAGDEADKGKDALQAFWKAQSKQSREKILPHMEDLKARALAAEITEPAENDNTNLEDPFGQKVAAAE